MLKCIVIDNNQIDLKIKPLSESLNELFTQLHLEGVSDKDIAVQYQITANTDLDIVYETALVIWRDNRSRAV
jgi:hypothetical protein